MGSQRMAGFALIRRITIARSAQSLPMRILLNVLAVLALLIGGVWLLQGVNVLLGSFMSGQPKWAIIGGCLIALGLVFLFIANRRQKGA